jgi:hypothetical protein
MMEIPTELHGRAVTPRGVHLAPTGYFPWADEADDWIDLLVQMGMSWVVVLSEGDAFYQSGIPHALLAAGIIPIVRFAYQFPKVWTHGEATAQLAALYDQHGAPLVVQFANEPFDAREWRDGEVPPYEEAWAVIAQRWHEAANAIAGNGGVAGFPDGPCYAENPFARIGDGDHHWEEGRAVYLGHHYGKGRPLAYPQDDVSKWGMPLTMEGYREALDDYADDLAWNEGEAVLAMMNVQRAEWADPDLSPLDDDTCWRGWEKVQWYADQAFGHQVQMAMTEGGWTPRDRAGSDPVDIRWPYTTPNKVAEKTLAMYEWPSPLFAVCPWLLACSFLGGTGWEDDAWVGGSWYDKYGPQKPVVQMLIDNPPGGGGNGGEVVEELEDAQAVCGAVAGHLAAALGMLDGLC